MSFSYLKMTLVCFQSESMNWQQTIPNLPSIINGCTLLTI